jgi:hypothetical protein
MMNEFMIGIIVIDVVLVVLASISLIKSALQPWVEE